MSDATSLTIAEPEFQGTQTQIAEKSKALIAARPKVSDEQQMTQQYLTALSKIKEVELACYRPRKQCIEFVVVVAGRVHRKLSQQLACIEGQLYDDYPDWSFNFEHLSHRAYTQQLHTNTLSKPIEES